MFSLPHRLHNMPPYLTALTVAISSMWQQGVPVVDGNDSQAWVCKLLECPTDVRRSCFTVVYTHAVV